MAAANFLETQKLLIFSSFLKRTFLAHFLLKSAAANFLLKNKPAFKAGFFWSSAGSWLFCLPKAKHAGFEKMPGILAVRYPTSLGESCVATWLPRHGPVNLAKKVAVTKTALLKRFFILVFRKNDSALCTSGHVANSGKKVGHFAHKNSAPKVKGKS